MKYNSIDWGRCCDTTYNTTRKGLREKSERLIINKKKTIFRESESQFELLMISNWLGSSYCDWKCAVENVCIYNTFIGRNDSNIVPSWLFVDTPLFFKKNKYGLRHFKTVSDECNLITIIRSNDSTRLDSMLYYANTIWSHKNTHRRRRMFNEPTRSAIQRNACCIIGSLRSDGF